MNNDQNPLTQPPENLGTEHSLPAERATSVPISTDSEDSAQPLTAQGVAEVTAPGATPMPYLALDLSHSLQRVRFFWQRWRESLDTIAPVSVRARTSGPRELLRELKEVEELIAHADIGHGDRTAIHEEAFGVKASGVSVAGVVVSDPVVLNRASDLMDTWKAANTGFLSGSQPTEVEAGRRTAVLRQLQHHLDSTYRPTLFSLLEKAVFPQKMDAPSDEEQQHVDAIVSALVTDLLTDGFSAYFLRSRGERTEKAMNAGPSEAQKFLREFFKRFLRPAEKTTVVVKAKASKEFWGSWHVCSDRKIGETVAIVLPGEYTERWSRRTKRQFGDVADPGVRFGVWEVLAHDRGHAARLAYQAFERVSDAICFVAPGVSPPLLDAVATVRAGDPTVLEAVTKRDAEFTFRPLRTSLSDVRGRRPDLASFSLGEDSSSAAGRRLTGALRAQRIAREENWLESGLTTLWTAIETLAYERYAGNIIDSVVRSVIPFACATKIKDLTDDLVAYLEWSGVRDLSAFKNDFADVHSGGSVAPAKLLHVLSEPARAQQLAALGSPSPLFQYRVRRFHDAVKTGKNAALRTCQSAKRVDWQLRRVYRLRNGIIHGAKFGGTGEQLLEHLDSYVRAVLGPLSQILSSDNGITTVEQAVAAVDGRFEAWRQWALGLTVAPSAEEAERLYRPAYTALWETGASH
jgi:hypothetical protein